MDKEASDGGGGAITIDEEESKKVKSLICERTAKAACIILALFLLISGLILHGTMRNQGRRLYRRSMSSSYRAPASVSIALSEEMSSKLLDLKKDQKYIADVIEIKNASLNGSEEFCREPTIREFPTYFLPTDYAWLLINVLIIIYLLVAIAIVCEDFFLDVLTKLARDLNINEDVAGATFLAAGSSSPELFTSIIGVTIAKSDIGVGTIIGSTLFNSLFIVAVCAFAAKSVLKVDFYPVVRDSFYNFFSVVLLIVVLYDGYIYWYEALLFLILYSIYIIHMYFNGAIERKIKSLMNSDEEIVEKIVEHGEVEEEASNHHADVFYPFKFPQGFFSTIKWVLLLPIKILFYLTIPDSKRNCFSKFPVYFLTFFMSCAYIGIFTYGVVWMVVIIAYNLNIPDTLVGMTFLAAGTTLPEMITSVLLTRRNKAAMAIANVTGSNVFDILLCLGLPWFLQSSIIDRTSPVQVYSGGIIFIVSFLICSIIGLLTAFFVTGWKLSKSLGIFLMLLWCIITFIATLFEYDFFGKFSMPVCE